MNKKYQIIERLYISKDQANLLKLFENGLDLGWQLLSSKEARQVDQVKDFLKSMIEQVVVYVTNMKTNNTTKKPLE